MKSARTFLCAVLTSLFIFSSMHPLQYYTVIDLGTLGGSSSYAMSVNNSGQIAGAADENSSSYQRLSF